MLVWHSLEMAHIQIESHPLEGDDAIACDADYLQQAFVTLLVNAAETMPGGGHLRVHASSADGSVRVEISAKPHSVPSEMPPSILGPVVSAVANDHAAALGLAGVDLIIQRHGGTIEVDASPGNCMTVRLFLPRSPLRTGGARM
jgi:signal transduction histidine kinase